MRVWMLLWLMCRGHWTWTRKTKAWREIIKNSTPNREEGFQSLSHVAHVEDENKSAGDYVTKYMHRKDEAHAFALKPVRVANKGSRRPRDHVLV